MENAAPARFVNAWIFLNDDYLPGTNYYSHDSCYQSLIRNNVYQSVDFLHICFTTTMPHSAGASAYTLTMGEPATPIPAHPGGYTNKDYLQFIIRDARIQNPGIKFIFTLDWGYEPTLSNIFTVPGLTDAQCAAVFARNLAIAIQGYGLDGFDFDWEPPLSGSITAAQMSLLLYAIRQQFNQLEKENKKHYYLIISPVTGDNLDAAPVNDNVDWLNLQLYGGTTPSNYPGVDYNLFAYGAQFEATQPTTDPNFPGLQTAQAAIADNNQQYHFPIYTNWRLNSGNFVFEQQQQVALYRLARAGVQV